MRTPAQTSRRGMAEKRLLAILLNARGAQTGQTMLVDRVLPRQELFNGERVARAGFLKGEEAATDRCDHFGLTPNDPALCSRCRQVRNRQRASVGADHVLRPWTQGLIHEENSRTRLTNFRLKLLGAT